MVMSRVVHSVLVEACIREQSRSRAEMFGGGRAEVKDRVTHADIEDGLVNITALRADLLWEECPETADWHHRTPEFVEARAEARAALPDQLAAAEIALARIMLDLESSLPAQIDGRPWVRAEDGYLYVTIHHEAHDSATVIAGWLAKLAKYRAVTPGDILWWRSRPLIRADVAFHDRLPTWHVRCRLRIGTMADTLMAKLVDGRAVPTKWMVEDGEVTESQLRDMGWYRNEMTGEYERVSAA